MEFKSPTVRRIRNIKGQPRIIKIETLSSENNHNLNLYSKPSSENISLLDFQELGEHRIKILRKIENLKERYGSGKQEYVKEFEKDMRTLMPIAVGVCGPTSQLDEERRKDRLSHFILRLAFCQNTDHTNWFIQQETELFRMRFKMEKLSEILQFLDDNNICLEEASVDEKNNFCKELAKVHRIPIQTIPHTTIFKVDFDQVFELFFNYKLFLRRGIAYITVQQLLAVISPKFRENLATSMAFARRHISQLYADEEDRIIPMLNHFTQKGISYKSDFKDKCVDDVTPEMIEELSKVSFPLCMRSIHSRLRADHHLRYFARRQYGLFLKGVGTSMESALAFFRNEFVKKIDQDKFSKEYSYNIRHMYGQEGSRKEGVPLSCASIILGNGPVGQDCHGCPYRHADSNVLSKNLENLGLRSDKITKIVDLSKSHQYDKACARYFEATHKMAEGALGCVIAHPNEYYSLSRKILSGERPMDSGAATQKISFEL